MSHQTNGYKLAELGSVLSLIRNGMSIKQTKEADGLPITRIETISTGEIDAARVGFAGVTTAAHSQWLLTPGDILLSHINSEEHLGKVALYDGSPRELVHGMNLLNLRADRTQILPEYLLRVLRSDLFRRQVKRVSNRSVNQASVSITALNKLEIPLPPLSEQKRIADILDKADTIRCKRKDAITTADSIRDARFSELFGDPASQDVWPMRTVGQCLQDGTLLGVQDGNHGNDHPKVAEFQPFGIPFIAANCLTRNRLDLDGCPCLTKERTAKLRIGFSTARDVLLTHKASLGFTCVVPDDVTELMLTPQVTYYRCDQTRLNPHFLSAYFRTPFFQQTLKQGAMQSTRAYIGITRQKDLPVLLPPLKTQNQFADLIVRLSAFIAQQEAAQSEVNCLFDSLVQRAFRGEL